MKILRNKLLPLAVILSLISCSDDYGLMEPAGETWQSGLCVAVPHEGFPYVLQMDKGDKIVDGGEPESNVKIGNRYSVYYSLIKPKQEDEVREAEIARMIPVTTIPLTYPDSLRTSSAQGDPIEISKAFWLGGDFINVEFNFKISDSQIKHTLKLLFTSFDEEDKELKLDFIHLANGDLPVEDLPAIVSFPLKSIYEFNQADTILIRVMQKNRQGENHYSYYGLKGGCAEDQR
ncbi:MAG TPA: NigD-like C-terminal domain-containing protein [Bacteroidales bacterium]|nr:NigD-like C-terminal domain-containing protein [Bacteroidales bacterium]